MARIYDNPIPVNNGVKVIGPAPQDDRLQLENLSDIFVNAGSPERCTLYGNIYQFATVVVADAQLLILKDVTPYLQGNKITVNEQNYLNYWKSFDKEIFDSMHFDGGSDPDSQYTITPTGNLPSGTTIGQLETMTFSEILKQILFEFCTPHKIQDASFSASLTGNYASGKAVEVGADYPTSANFSTTYAPEKWQWVSSVNSSVKGPEAALSNQGTIKYYYNSTNSTTGGTELPSALKAKEGINGYFYAEQAQNAGTHPVDSRGNTRDGSGNYYANTRTDTLKSTTLTFQAGWRAYSNATKTYSSVSAAWSARNTNPGAFAGNDTKTPTSELILFNTTHTYYFQWPANTTDAQVFHIYCPQTYKIDSIYAASNTATNTFDVESGVTQGSNVSITNTLGQTGTFKSYTVLKAAGITNVQVVFKKV